ncbi:hypothetical protein [Sediminibacillus massiliensis]|nr:hypothetical protein [Sediminibacillus massiliensis]
MQNCLKLFEDPSGPDSHQEKGEAAASPFFEEETCKIIMMVYLQFRMER